MSDYKFGTKIQNSDNKVDRVYFMIFYNEKENAKKLGYKWDKEKRSWYKDLIYSKTLQLHYDINKNHNEKHIYEKYNELINMYDKVPIIDEENIDKIQRTKDILYSC